MLAKAGVPAFCPWAHHIPSQLCTCDFRPWCCCPSFLREDRLTEGKGPELRPQGGVGSWGWDPDQMSGAARILIYLMVLPAFQVLAEDLLVLQKGISRWGKNSCRGWTPGLMVHGCVGRGTHFKAGMKDTAYFGELFCAEAILCAKPPSTPESQRH